MNLSLDYPLFLLDKGDNPEEKHSADDSGDDLSHESATPMDTKPSEDIAADKTTDNTHKKVDQKAETGSFHDFACQKTSQGSDKNADNNTHNFFLLVYNVL
jgi:hypothetical protein